MQTQVAEGIVWSGWVGGLGIGLLMLMCFWITGKALGASRSYCALLAPASKLRFFARNKADFNFTRIYFLVGVPLGGGLAVLTSPGVEWSVTSSLGPMYDLMLPGNPWFKSLLLFVGGVMLAVGARMAGGCTSGNVIVGVSQLSLASILSGILFFVAGIVTVGLMYRVSLWRMI